MVTIANRIDLGITRIEKQKDGILLHVEDFFGHEQYGIPSNRKLTPDYLPGNEVLIADGINDARAKVIRVDDKARTVLVTSFEEPKGGWLIKYASPLPKKENPTAPGLFADSGCYLRKFSPVGTPHYYWGRLDKEWDIAIKRYNRRIVPRFTNGTGDLSLDGRSGTTAKDLLQHREVSYAFTKHTIERYGDVCLTFPWTVLNEPDLWPVYWRTQDWDNLQQFYDYTVDGILRAFEDQGYDSDKVFIGGLELGAIFGLNLKLHAFVAHCSPNAEHEDAVPLNAAFADKRLDGKRSRRVEKLCRANNGRGTPGQSHELSLIFPRGSLPVGWNSSLPSVVSLAGSLLPSCSSSAATVPIGGTRLPLPERSLCEFDLRPL
jgi:hypothetical protein